MTQTKSEAVVEAGKLEIELYKIIIDLKKTEEEKRDRTNGFYVTTCSLIFSLMPFLSSLGEKFKVDIMGSLKLIPFVGMAIVGSWLLSMSRSRHTLGQIKAYTETVKNEQYQQLFKLGQYQMKYSKQQALFELAVPYAFLVGFIFTLLREFIY